MTATLRKVNAPSGPDMDAKLGDAVAHRLRVAKQTSFKPLDPSDHNAANRGVCETVEPRGELRKRFDAEHGSNVIERLHSVKTAWPDRRKRKSVPTPTLALAVPLP